jgi:hypothetical protein
MSTIEELITEAAKHNRTFHPIDAPTGLVWFPGNEAAALAIQSTHIWDDIIHLIEMRSSQGDKYRRRLILKYVVVELRSLMEVTDRLQSHVMKAPVIGLETSTPWRGITLEERREAKSLYKEYSLIKKKSEALIIGIRDNIGAHRGNLDWRETGSLWESISVDQIQPLLDILPRVFAHIKELDIFEWNRTPEDGVIEILGPPIQFSL